MRVNEHEGAVEGDKPSDKEQGNKNAQQGDGALDDQGMPKDKDKIAQDRLGANLDETQG